MRKQAVANIVWGLGFVGISLIGGVVIGGLVEKHLGLLVAGACWAVLGGILLFQPATFSPQANDDEFHVFVTFSRLQRWAWVAVGVLAVAGVISMIALKDALI